MTIKKPSRNDPCPCGSGKKYKQCCSRLGGGQSASPAPATGEIAHALQTAVGHQQAGRLPQAEAIYRQILQAAPNHPDALHLLGLIAHQVGKHEIAVELISKALVFVPNYAEAHNNLGVALNDQGKPDEAVACYRRALRLKPDYVEAHYNLG
ncbi:MAG: tetratricopeptide repeat protein, partial [Nitrosomonadales bacterium]|nr:tetratricopeptide repeat protein [Nitrosomonadales bacterium]